MAKSKKAPEVLLTAKDLCGREYMGLKKFIEINKQVTIHGELENGITQSYQATSDGETHELFGEAIDGIWYWKGDGIILCDGKHVVKLWVTPDET